MPQLSRHPAVRDSHSGDGQTVQGACPYGKSNVAGPSGSVRLIRLRYARLGQAAAQRDIALDQVEHQADVFRHWVAVVDPMVDRVEVHPQNIGQLALPQARDFSAARNSSAVTYGSSRLTNPRISTKV